MRDEATVSCVDDWLARAAARHPERSALETADRAVSYEQLAAGAARGVWALGRDGVKRGERVPIEVTSPILFAEAVHACLQHGAAAVPIDPRLSVQERRLRAVRGATSFGPGVATVVYTSGTTSAPKAVELTTGNWFANACGSALALGLDPAERWLCPMPLVHVGGLSILIRSAIYATSVVLHERFDTEAVLAELMDPGRRITLVSVVPTMLARLLDAGLRSPPTLRWALLGGGPIPASLLARAETAGVPVAPTYGMTEACSQIATFGVPLHGVELQIADDGEIQVRGAVVAPGALDPDGWLHTGDLGTLDERGRLVITGRKADTIITGGENVAPAEIEAVLLAHPAIADAAVFGRADEEWGEMVVASVVARDGAPVIAEDVRAFCAQRLASFKVPKVVEVVGELPRNPLGKLRRRELI
jgi:O-succinylbenzoic acid--CoA ligase